MEFNNPKLKETPNPKKQNNRSIGSKYEGLAAEYLEKLGMTIVERNYRTRYGEIDIIARDKTFLVFVEVKYRKNADNGYALESIDRKKQSQIKKMALQYINSDKVSGYVPMRFDCVGITGDEFRYVKNAF